MCLTRYRLVGNKMDKKSVFVESFENLMPKLYLRMKLWKWKSENINFIYFMV